MIRVGLMHRAGRKWIEAQWTDPVTGRLKTKSLRTNERRKAERLAAVLEADLNEGRAKEPLRTTWAEFRRQYEADTFPGQAKKTRDKTRAMFKAVERIISPLRLAAVDANQVRRFKRELRAEGLAEYTVKGHLAELRKTLRWAVRNNLLAEVPSIEMPKRPGGMKGRPITAEEFERMLDAVPKVVAPEVSDWTLARLSKTARAERESRCKRAVETWRFLLRGLWWSGLRIEEALQLHWTSDRMICVDLSGRRPMFRVRAEADKARVERLYLPMAPEFAELLETVQQRTGHVFNPTPRRGPEHIRLRSDWVSKVISQIGETAGVKVAERTGGSGELQVKYASAHDLRRAFGFRWSQRVLPPVLMQLMRHESIQTTMQFYVGRQAEAAADTLWNAVATNTSPNTSDSGAPDSPETPVFQHTRTDSNGRPAV